MKNKKINIIRKKLDKLDLKMLSIIKKRSLLVNQILKQKEFKNQIIDKKRIKIILKKISKESKKKKIDPKITMAKKSHIKVRMVPESNPDSKFIYYAKKPTKGEKVKEKLKLKKYNPNTRKHEFFVEKKLPPHSK